MDESVVYIVVVCCALLSLLGSFSILVIYFSFENLQAFPYTLVGWLAFCDFITASTLLMPTVLYKSGYLCTVQATLISFSSLASILFTSTIAHALHSILIRSVALERVYSWLRLYVAYAVGIALIGAIVPMCLGFYQVAGAWCWIIPEQHPLIALGAFYAPMLFVLVYNFVVVFIIFRAMRYELNRQRQRVVWKIMMYPLVMAVCIGPLTLLRVAESVGGGFGGSWLSEYAVMQYSLFGFFNFIVYGLTQKVRKTLKQWLTGQGTVESEEDDSLLMDSFSSGPVSLRNEIQ